MNTIWAGAAGFALSALLSIILYGYFGSATEVTATELDGAMTVGSSASSRSILSNKDGLICAEPSPDVMLTLLNSANVEGQGEQAATNANGSVNLSQSADPEQIFSRSQGIQALRDGMYRLCEAHLNGAIPKDTYVEQMTDLVATLNFIVPIELCSKLNTDLARLKGQKDETSRNGASSAVQADAVDANKQPDTEMATMAALLGQCIQSSYQFGTNLAANSSERGRARLTAQRGMFETRSKIAYGLLVSGMDCKKIAELSQGEIDCDVLGIRPSPSVR